MSTHEPTATIIISSKKARHGLPENKLPPVHLAAQQHFRPTIVTRLKQPAPKRPLLGRRPFYLARQQAKLKRVLIAGFQVWAIPRAKHSLSPSPPHPFKAPSTHHNMWHNIFFFFVNCCITFCGRQLCWELGRRWVGKGRFLQQYTRRRSWNHSGQNLRNKQKEKEQM